MSLLILPINNIKPLFGIRFFFPKCEFSKIPEVKQVRRLFGLSLRNEQVCKHMPVITEGQEQSFGMLSFKYIWSTPNSDQHIFWSTSLAGLHLSPGHFSKWQYAVIPFTLEPGGREVLGHMQQENIAPALYRYFSAFCKIFFPLQMKEQ